MDSTVTLIVTIIVSAGIPSAVVGFYFRKLEKKIDRQTEYDAALLSSVKCNSHLSQETARHAIRKQCANGFLTESLQQSVKASTDLEHIVQNRAVRD